MKGSDKGKEGMGAIEKRERMSTQEQRSTHYQSFSSVLVLKRSAAVSEGTAVPKGKLLRARRTWGTGWRGGGIGFLFGGRWFSSRLVRRALL